MARRKQGMGVGTDSLELFLDAICNAFGGIIFISLLICLMLQLSGEVVGAVVSPEERARREAQLRDIQAEIGRLLGILKIQEKQLGALKTTANPERHEKYLILIKKENKVRKERQVLWEELSGILIELEKEKGRFVRLIAEKGALEGQKKEREKELERLKDRRGMHLSVPPGAHRTEKIEVPLLLEHGRVVFVMKYDNRGKRTAHNEAEVTFAKVSDKEVVDGRTIRARFGIRAKAGVGLVINAGNEPVKPEERDKLIKAMDRQLADMLKQFTNKPTNGIEEKDCHYFKVAVWPDSYPHFEILRDLLIRKEFGYGLVLMRKDESVISGGVGKREEE